MANSPAPVILPLYSPISGVRSRSRQAAVFAAKLAAAAAYGAAAVLLPPQLLFILILPVVVLLLLALWMMPDRGVFPLTAIVRSYWVYLPLTILWPVYIAVVLPGLPWLTPTRAMLFIITFFFLYSAATSGVLRRHLGIVAKISGLFWAAFLMWQVSMVVSIPFSNAIGATVKIFLDNQLRLTEILFLGALIFSRRGTATRTIGCLLVLAVICSIDGFVELRLGYPPWANHIPSFMRVDEATMAIVLGAQARSADGIYRVRGPFPLSLVFAEYLALCSPFVLHWLITGRTLLLRAAMAVTWLLGGIGILITQSRLGLVGAMLGHAVYLPLWALRQWRADRSALLGPFVLFGTPFLALTALAVIFSSHTLTQKIMGGGAAAASNAQRALQRAAAMPKIMNHPLGHGLGQSGTALGVVNAGGIISVDNHFITTGLDLGFLGLIGFYGMFIAAVWIGLRTYLTTHDRETELAGPLAVMFLVFFMIKTVLSQENNHPLVLLLLGMMIALAARERRLVDPDNLFPSER